MAAGVSEWSKEQGLGPCRVGVRGFEPHPPHFLKRLFNARTLFLPEDNYITTIARIITVSIMDSSGMRCARFGNLHLLPRLRLRP